MRKKTNNSADRKTNKSIGKAMMIIGLLTVVCQFIYAMHQASDPVIYKSVESTIYDVLYFSFPPASFFIGYQIYRNNED